jgi:hypothetical protein
LQILQVIEPDEPAVVTVKVEKKRKRTGVIVIHDTDSEGGEGEEDTAGNDASDDEITRMERRLNAMEVSAQRGHARPSALLTDLGDVAKSQRAGQEGQAA